VSAVLAWWKPVVLGLLVSALLIVGWKAKGWYEDSRLLIVARNELRAELQRRVMADAERLGYQRKLQEAEIALRAKVATVVKVIREHAPKGSQCDIGEPVVSELSKLRSGQ
jgi:hypothetical protein